MKNKKKHYAALYERYPEDEVDNLIPMLKTIRKIISEEILTVHVPLMLKVKKKTNFYNELSKKILDIYDIERSTPYGPLEILRIYRANEKYLITDPLIALYKDLITQKNILGIYPPFVNKKKINNDLREEFRKAIRNKDLKLYFITDILDKYREESNIKALEVEKQRKELIKTATLTDLEKFYYQARRKKRRIIAHLGPTNSGKTYNALKHFNEAYTGIYLAPLRLLAREVYDSFKDTKNISMITGEEILKSENETHVSSTIEMVNFNQEYEVAIIDEIQMIEDPQRGAAWTRALMGVNADIVYVIGSEDSEDIIKTIVEKCGDTLEIKKHKRLTPLKKIEEPVPLSNLQKGDAVICFSRNDIFDIKTYLEEEYGYSIAVVYGALPPSARLEQANLFNEGKKDILIATDAIGMGLNLNIKRVLFSAIVKYDGKNEEILSPTLFKQIAGRAGRYKKFDYGEVGILEGLNKEIFNELWNSKLDKKIEKAIFFPEFEHLSNFGKAGDYGNNLTEIVGDYSIYFTDNEGIFKIADISEFIKTSNAIDSYPLSLEDKYLLSFVPMPRKSYQAAAILYHFIQYRLGKEELKPFYYFHSKKEIKKAGLLKLELIHKELMEYIWLANRLEVEEEIIKDLMELNEEIAYKINGRLL